MFVRVAQRRARTVVHRPVKLRVPHHAKPRLLPLLVRSLATQATASQTTTAGAAGQQQSASSASQASKVTLTQSTSNALPQVTISESAKKRLRQLAVEDKNTGGLISYLRLAVDPGGCNGFLAKFSMEDSPLRKDDYIVFEDKSGAKVIIDEISLNMLSGATIDYISELARSAFVLAEIPKATSMCGCKVSFNVDL